MGNQSGILDWMCEERSSENGRRALVFGLLLVFTTVANWGVFTDWNYTHWLFDYDFGLIKRGLAGQLAASLGMARSYENMRAFCAVLALVLEGALVFLFTRTAAVDSKLTGGWLFALFWLTHPCTVPHFLYDMGRLDNLSLLICALAVVATLHLPHRVALALSILSSSLLILVHEANVLLFIPVMVACWMYAAWDELRVLDWLLLGLGLAWLVGLELSIGSIAAVPGYSLQSFKSYLEASSSHIDIKAIEPLFRSPNDHFTYNAEYREPSHIALDYLFLVLGLAPSFVLIVHMGKAAYEGVKIRVPDLVLAGAVASPLLVSALGADHFRWFSIALTNLGLALVVVARSHATSAKLAEVTFRHKGLVFTCVALHCALGAVAHDSTFDTLWRFSYRVFATLAFSPGAVVE